MRTSITRSNSPYKNIKSKVAANLASQKKARKMNATIIDRQKTQDTIFRTFSQSPSRKEIKTVNSITDSQNETECKKHQTI